MRPVAPSEQRARGYRSSGTPAPPIKCGRRGREHGCDQRTFPSAVRRITRPANAWAAGPCAREGSHAEPRRATRSRGALERASETETRIEAEAQTAHEAESQKEAEAAEGLRRTEAHTTGTVRDRRESGQTLASIHISARLGDDAARAGWWPR
eukprot:COSAG06_NODE_4257_length_4426_cov_2.805870_2_plen_153_part_00